MRSEVGVEAGLVGPALEEHDPSGSIGSALTAYSRHPGSLREASHGVMAPARNSSRWSGSTSNDPPTMTMFLAPPLRPTDATLRRTAPHGAAA